MYIIDKLELIHQSYKNSAIEYILAHYFLTHLDDLRTLNLKIISMETHLSTSSIIRFCQSCGCEGFTIFMNELQNEIEEIKNNVHFYNHFDMMVHEDVEKDFMKRCFENLKEVYNQLMTLLINSRRIFLYGHQRYLGCLQYLQTSLFVTNKDVINNMCWYIDNQRELFSSFNEQDVIIIIEPHKNWRSYKELLIIHGDTLHNLENTKAKKIFIGQDKNDEIDVSITLPYTYYDAFYKSFLIKLDTMLVIDMNTKKGNGQ